MQSDRAHRLPHSYPSFSPPPTHTHHSSPLPHTPTHQGCGGQDRSLGHVHAANVDQREVPRTADVDDVVAVAQELEPHDICLVCVCVCVWGMYPYIYVVWGEEEGRERCGKGPPRTTYLSSPSHFHSLSPCTTRLFSTRTNTTPSHLEECLSARPPRCPRVKHRAPLDAAWLHGI